MTYKNSMGIFPYKTASHNYVPTSSPSSLRDRNMAATYKRIYELYRLMAIQFGVVRHLCYHQCLQEEANPFFIGSGDFHRCQTGGMKGADSRVSCSSPRIFYLEMFQSFVSEGKKRRLLSVVPLIFNVDDDMLKRLWHERLVSRSSTAILMIVPAARIGNPFHVDSSFNVLLMSPASPMLRSAIC